LTFKKSFPRSKFGLTLRYCSSRRFIALNHIPWTPTVLYLPSFSTGTPKQVLETYPKPLRRFSHRKTALNN
jgi:hypothetical protein